jgi:hypothetical protein
VGGAGAIRFGNFSQLCVDQRKSLQQGAHYISIAKRYGYVHRRKDLEVGCRSVVVETCPVQFILFCLVLDAPKLFKRSDWNFFVWQWVLELHVDFKVAFVLPGKAFVLGTLTISEVELRTLAEKVTLLLLFTQILILISKARRNRQDWLHNVALLEVCCCRRLGIDFILLENLQQAIDL